MDDREKQKLQAMQKAAASSNNTSTGSNNNNNNNPMNPAHGQLARLSSLSYHKSTPSGSGSLGGGGGGGGSNQTTTTVHARVSNVANVIIKTKLPPTLSVDPNAVLQPIIGVRPPARSVEFKETATVAVSPPTNRKCKQQN